MVTQNSVVIFAKNIHGPLLRHLVMEVVGRHGQNGLFTRSNVPHRSSPRHFMVTQNSDVIFAKILHGLLLRCLIWSQLVAMVKTNYLQGPMSPREGKPPILPIFVCYSPLHCMVTRNFNIIVRKNLHGPPLRP
ncbi:hypothetical protein H5410_049313 [Solanum commersonii]|uniref:Uncharacterized protein n=1 Tax=Solanum commersonii TaxID=4109 RepID=A0A9J5WUR0_SOLCO|nr:hypothetical protein H5410_049313 [Solanum commersonii]